MTAISTEPGKPASTLRGFRITGLAPLAQPMPNGRSAYARLPLGGILPLAAVLLGFGLGGHVGVLCVILGVCWPIMTHGFRGLTAADPQLVEMARAYGMGPLRLLRRVILPTALPDLRLGLWHAAGVMALVVVMTLQTGGL